jgi:hypothetical protein
MNNRARRSAIQEEIQRLIELNRDEDGSYSLKFGNRIHNGLVLWFNQNPDYRNIEQEAYAEMELFRKGRQFTRRTCQMELFEGNSIFSLGEEGRHVYLKDVTEAQMQEWEQAKIHQLLVYHRDFDSEMSWCQARRGRFDGPRERLEDMEVRVFGLDPLTWTYPPRDTMP